MWRSSARNAMNNRDQKDMKDQKEKQSTLSIITRLQLYVIATRCCHGKNKTVPAMPFVSLSYGIGAFGLLPFVALWRPDETLSVALSSSSCWCP